MPEMPAGAEEGIIQGMYRLAQRPVPDAQAATCTCWAAGRCCGPRCGPRRSWRRSIGVASDVWSVTSYSQLRREAQACARWNMLHPAEKPRRSYLEDVLDGSHGVFVASSDYVRAVAEQIRPWVPGELTVLGCDGLGRSDTREALRRHFEVDAECIVVAALHGLQRQRPAAGPDGGQGN